MNAMSFDLAIVLSKFFTFLARRLIFSCGESS